MPLVEINTLIDNKSFFHRPVKTKQQAHEKLIEMSKNDDYTIENLLDYLHHQKYYKLISIDLLRQTNLNIPQQINFTGKIEEDEKQHKTILNFSLDSLMVTE